MAVITTRAGKGSPLTHAEMDANLTNLNTNKLEVSVHNTHVSDLASTASGKGDALLGHLPEGTGAVGIDANTFLRKALLFTDNYATLDQAITAATTLSCGVLRLPPGDVTYLGSNIAVTTSIIIEGAMSGSGEMASRILCPTSGLNFERAAGADNIIGIHVKNIRIEKTGTAKAAGSYGVKLVGANSNISFDNVEVRYFEKNWWFVGVIGAQFRNIAGFGGKYGLYTESHAPLSYDTTNCDLYGAKFNNSNETGVYLGPLTQGLNFHGGNIERNTVVGVEFANTAPASSAINFFGTWFEENPTHWKFTQKPIPVVFQGCYINGGTNLWSNNASGTITATVRECRLSASIAVDMDIFNGTWEGNSTDGTLTFNATEPNGYYFQKLRGTSFTIAGKTLYNVENIGAGIYKVWAAGVPFATGFVKGSEWIDTTNNKHYTYTGAAWAEFPQTLSASAALDFGSVTAQTATTGLTIALSGAATGDTVSWTFSGDPLGLAFMARAETNTVRIYAINVTAGAIDPGSLTFTVRVFK